MSAREEPAAVVRAHVVGLRTLKVNGEFDARFDAGRARVSIMARRLASGDFDRGVSVVEEKLVRAVAAAQGRDERSRFEVEALEGLGLTASCEVVGPPSSPRPEL